MTALRESALRARTSHLRRSWRHAVRRSLPPEYRTVALLVLCTLLIVGALLRWPDVVPLTTLMVPLLLGSLLLGPRQLPWFVVFVLVMVMVSITNLDVMDDPRIGIAAAIFFVLGFIILMTSFRRSRLGVAGVLGESMLVDLRDRILGQGGIPALPDGWYAESALKSAGGTPFAGRLRRRHPPARRPARGRRGRRVRQGRAGGHPGAAALRRLRRPARPRCRRRSSCPPPTTTSCARSGRRASPPRSTSRSTWSPATSRSAPRATRRPCSWSPGPGAGR